MWYLIAADLVLVVHLLFIGFVVGGVFLAWRWPRVIWVHLPAMVYGALIEFIGFTCPLTPLQNYLRRRAGEAGYSGGDNFEGFVNLFGGGEAGEGEADAGASARGCEAHGGEDVGGFGCAGLAGGASADGEAFEVEGDDESFGF